MRLACRLRAIREERGLSLRELEAAILFEGDASGVTRAELSRIERGVQLPRDAWVPALERAYGAPASEWYGPPAGAVAGVAIERDARC